jgi:penicillin-binding protein 2
MKIRRQKKESIWVIWAISAVMMLGMSLILTSLWKLQVPRKGSFEDKFREQTIRRVRLPGIRGKIYDTNGFCLADSIPDYNIAIYTEELRQPRSAVANTLELLHEVWIRVGVSIKPDITYRDIKKHLLLTPDEPLVAWRNLSDEQAAHWVAEFEKWTAPRKGSSRRAIVRGLDMPITADNCISFNMRDLRRKSTSTAANTLELVYQIEERIGRKREVSFRDIKNHIFARKPLPLLAWSNIDADTIARWADSCSMLPGTDIYTKATRFYPEGENMAHLIGYTMDADTVKEEAGEKIDFDMRGLQGKSGLESLYNQLLLGVPGTKLVQVDVSGYHHQDLQTKRPESGGDLMLTIDANIQQFAKDALTMRLATDPFEGPVQGAVVILDPNNGDVLAMVSSPSYDPNRYMRNNSYRQELLKDESARTYNRAIYGKYAPGSIFKPIAALGILRAYPEYATVTHDCPGYHMIGKRKMRCNARYGHGELDLRQTLEHSCNVFMYKMVLEFGYEPIRLMASEFGLGSPAGLFPDLENDTDNSLTKGSKYGNLPDKALNNTDACNLSIGQGAIQVAPLQMAMAAAAIGNGGTLYRPRLIKKFRHQPNDPFQTNPTMPIRQINIPPEALEVVRGGMYDVVMSGRENAKCVQVGNIVIAGKTGTAEYGKKEEGKKNTWMISFAPFDHPRYAIAFIVENGVFGGTTVAPRLHELYKNIFTYDGTIDPEEADG